MNATERFLRYAAIPTRSDPDSTATPSTDCQFALARLLADELTALGADIRFEHWTGIHNWEFWDAAVRKALDHLL